MTPIDLIVQAIQNPDSIAPRNGYRESDADWTRRVVGYALTDDRTVEHAVQALTSALRAEGFTVVQSGEPAGAEDLRDLVVAVLRSVGGA